MRVPSLFRTASRLIFVLSYPKHDTLVGRALDLYGEWNRDAHELLTQVLHLYLLSNAIDLANAHVYC